MSPSFSHPAYHKKASSIYAAYICLSKAYCYISGINWRCILDNIALINKISTMSSCLHIVGLTCII